MEKRVNSSITSTIWVFVFNIVCSVFPFIIRTLIIKHWGIDYLGLNSLFASIIQVLNLSELGLGGALIFDLYGAVAKSDNKRINELLTLYNRIYILIGIIILILGTIVSPILDLLIEGDYPQNINITIVYFMVLGQTVFAYIPFAYCNAAFQSGDKLYISYRRSSFIFLINYLVQIFIICNSNNYYFFISFNLIGQIMAGVSNFGAMRKYYPDYRIIKISRGTFDGAYIRNVVKRVSAMMLSKIRVVFRNSIDSIIISALFGLVLVAKYQNYMLTMTVPMLLISSIMTGILPSFGNSVAIETEKYMAHSLRLISFITHWMATVFSALLMCYYQTFISLWIGDDGLLSDKCVILFCAYFYLRVIAEIPILIRNGTGIWWEGKWISIVETICNLVLNIILAKAIGLEGIIWATIVSMLLFNIPGETYYVFKYYFKTSCAEELKIIIKEGLIACITVCMTYYITKHITCNSIFSALKSIIVCITICNLILLLIYHNNDYFKESIKVLRDYYSFLKKKIIEKTRYND